MCKRRLCGYRLSLLHKNYPNKTIELNGVDNDNDNENKFIAKVGQRKALQHISLDEYFPWHREQSLLFRSILQKSICVDLNT